MRVMLLQGYAESDDVLRVEDAHVVLLTVCEQSGQLPHECGLAACDNGCSTQTLTFLRVERVPDG